MSPASFRNERNFRARRPKTAHVAVRRAWREAELANVIQRDDPIWISSFPRVAKCMPESSRQGMKNGMSLVLAREMSRPFLDREAVMKACAPTGGIGALFTTGRLPAIRPCLSDRTAGEPGPRPETLRRIRRVIRVPTGRRPRTATIQRHGAAVPGSAETAGPGMVFGLECELPGHFFKFGHFVDGGRKTPPLFMQFVPGIRGGAETQDRSLPWGR